MIEANWVGKTPEEYYELIGIYQDEEDDEEEGEEECK